MTLPNFIIGGAPKAATSSVFSYLAEHPEVVGSSVKETLFFTNGYSGELEADRAALAKYFLEATGTEKIAMEATPTYLGRAGEVAERIKKLLPDVKLLFILRDPVERLYSAYNYSLNNAIKGFKTTSFEEYVTLCNRVQSQWSGAKKGKIRAKHLRELDIGIYAKHLKIYKEIFSEENIKVVFYDDIRSDQVLFMKGICDFLGIDPAFYDDYIFERKNVTSVVRSRGLHKIARKIRDSCAGLVEGSPALSEKIEGAYNSLNRAQVGYEPMSDSIRKELGEFYTPCNRELKDILALDKLPWG